MRTRWAVPLVLSLGLTLPAPAGATDDISSAIEGFMAKQFPGARSYFWIVNGAEWETEEELVVDLQTVVTPLGHRAPSESRFLLLIVAGKLAAAQNIPLDAAPECKPEKA